MVDIERLREFLIMAKRKGYASVDGKEEKDVMKTEDGDGSTTIFFEEGELRYEDKYYGGEPFGGSEVVFYKDRAVWMMVYYGKVILSSDKDIVYPFLKRMLSLIMPEKPFRGPGLYSERNMEYQNFSVGDIEEFSGTEKIMMFQKEIYRANYAGGLVNQ